ncbi:hypothetical protein HLV35_05920 [Eggerthellaceae bacterium zg-997]|nr:hypothetical protein [Eggerthellaceae bacterium zg-997]
MAKPKGSATSAGALAQKELSDEVYEEMAFLPHDRVPEWVLEEKVKPWRDEWDHGEPARFEHDTGRATLLIKELGGQERKVWTPNRSMMSNKEIFSKIKSGEIAPLSLNRSYYYTLMDMAKKKGVDVSGASNVKELKAAKVKAPTFEAHRKEFLSRKAAEATKVVRHRNEIKSLDEGARVMTPYGEGRITHFNWGGTVHAEVDGEKKKFLRYSDIQPIY